MFFAPKEFKDCKSSTDKQANVTKSTSTFGGEHPSLLIILDDKNRTISLLQEQLSNQKKQLSYYLNQAFDKNKLQKLSLKCIPQVVDENIAVDLSLTRFCKQTGQKSRLMKVHERMCTIDGEIRRVVRKQQCVLHDILNSMYDIVSSDDDINNARNDASKLYDVVQPELFSEILNATLKLVQTLDMFRICADRLLIIEDERNEIVEQVCALSAEQRLNCNYIIGIQMDKMNLEDQVKIILQEQAKLTNRLKEFTELEEAVNKLQLQSKLNCEFSPEISALLEQINEDAMAIFESSESNKIRQSNEIKKLQTENENLREMVKENYLTLEVPNACQIEKEYFVQLKSMYELVKKNFDYEKMSIQRKVNESQSIVTENELLKNQLDLLVAEKDVLNKQIETFKANLEEIRSEYTSEIDLIKAERDSFKNQVDDLLAIRAAYSQLIEKQTEKCAIEKDYVQRVKKLENIISDFKIENELLRKKSSSYEDICMMQKSQIKYLFKIVRKLTGMYEEYDELRSNRTAEKLLDYNPSQKDNFCTECTSTHDEDYDMYSKNVHTKDILLQKLEKEPISITSSLLGNVSHKNASISNANIVISSNLDDNKDSKGNNDSSNVDSVEKTTNNSDRTTTYLRLRSTGKTGKTSSFTAVIKSTDGVDTSFSLGETRVILKLGATNTNVVKKTESFIAGNNNDDELLRDASNETLPHICSPIHICETISEEIEKDISNRNKIKLTEKSNNNNSDKFHVANDDFAVEWLNVSDVTLTVKKLSSEIKPEKSHTTPLSKAVVSSKLKRIHGIYS